MIARRSATLAAALFAVAAAAPAGTQAQDLSAGLRVVRLQAQPAELSLQVGQTVPFRVIGVDAAGDPVAGAALRMGGPRGTLRIDQDAGTVTGLDAGTFELVAAVILPPDADVQPPVLRVPVTVTWPAVTQVDIRPEPGGLYVGTTLDHEAVGRLARGAVRPDAQIRWSSSAPAVATVDAWGSVTAHAPGAVTITATSDGASGTVTYDVQPFPATDVVITTRADRIRTGDVVPLTADVQNASGAPIQDVPVTWSFTFTPDDSIAAPGAGGQILFDRFVAEVPGVYTLLATAGPYTARKTLDVRPREVVQQIQLVGRGNVTDVHTSDLWVYEGVDGRDYAVTGTWGGNGWAYFWDATDPGNLVKIDSIHVDARTVNDVKVAPNGRYAALSREGASNRRNGVVLIDLSNPRDPEIAANYDDGLTGGVHNMFALDDYLFALSGGDKYVILDVRDIRNPKYVSEYNHTGADGEPSRIHDVWVHDGIAYSSEWQNGVVVVDVGNGKWGGTIESPKLVTNVPYPVGATHASFPYFQQSTGKFYLFLGDEIMNRSGSAWAGTTPNLTERGGVPITTTGYYHIIDFTDPENPQDVARYEVPEFGTHNLWVEDDKLYTAYYEGGLRIVDVSGELLGNLANQGREIAVFKPFAPDGFIANAPMVWGPQPHKGHIFFSDFNSGIWSVKLVPPRRPAT
jgi:Bacterial Ig-like domain (group 2)/LVIVD repeat